MKKYLHLHRRAYLILLLLSAFITLFLIKFDIRSASFDVSFRQLHTEIPFWFATLALFTLSSFGYFTFLVISSRWSDSITLLGFIFHILMTILLLIYTSYITYIIFLVDFIVDLLETGQLQSEHGFLINFITSLFIIAFILLIAEIVAVVRIFILRRTKPEL